jgi:hypothetical protein
MNRSVSHASLIAVALAIAASLFGCAASGSAVATTGATSDGILMSGSAPLACADPTAFSTDGLESTWFVFCTGMSHVWVTSDWTTFDNQRAELQFDFADMPAASQVVANWWAPTVIFDPIQARYVMWVSVIDGQQSWLSMTRSLATFSAPAPLGPWHFEGYGDAVTKDGQAIIDPMIFHDAFEGDYLYWKQYGPGLGSSIMGAQLDDSLTHIVDGTKTVLLPGYGGTSWELNVRENPAVWQDVLGGAWHMLYSGAHWRNDTYATGHAISYCGPLCVLPGIGWSVLPSTDRGVAQVVQAKGNPDFAFGGPGGAVWLGSGGDWILYAAALHDHTRSLFLDQVQWDGDAPYVDRPGHQPE